MDDDDYPTSDFVIKLIQNIPDDLEPDASWQEALFAKFRVYQERKRHWWWRVYYWAEQVCRNIRQWYLSIRYE